MEIAGVNKWERGQRGHCGGVRQWFSTPVGRKCEEEDRGGIFPQAPLKKGLWLWLGNDFKWPANILATTIKKSEMTSLHTIRCLRYKTYG